MNRKYSILIFSILIALAGMLKADNKNVGNNYQNWMDSANTAYSNQQYDKAVMYYQQVLDHGITSADLHYNLGNAWYKQNRTAEAILHYEKALKYNPKHSDARFNLELANNRITDRITPPDIPFYEQWYNQLWQSQTLSEWTTISIVVFILLVFAVVIFIFTRSILTKKILLPVAILMLLLTFSSLHMASKAKSYVENDKNAIVFNYSLNVKSAPSKTGTDLFTIHEGLKIEILNEMGEWTRISIVDGRMGWIPSSAYKKI
ncbi:MAG: tetratricopeptide repeat protein [Salinivirgaceae bacterium]|jgi:tetratricopeptide (TPR) repeat protein|nr:tetratricopeptide repeat protein [Salinivirgaceae bacterium]